MCKAEESPKSSNEKIQNKISNLDKMVQKYVTDADKNSEDGGRSQQSGSKGEKAKAPCYVKFYKYEEIKQRCHIQDYKDKLRSKLQEKLSKVKQHTLDKVAKDMNYEINPDLILKLRQIEQAALLPGKQHKVAEWGQDL